MATNATAKSSTPSRFPFPCHLLVTGLGKDREALFKIWLISPQAKRQISARLLERYPGGFGVVSPSTQRLFAVVDPRGNARDLPPPHQFVEMWELANQPKAQTECACREFYDPEVGGPWKLRERDEHHPMCQFDRTSMPVFQRAHRESTARVAEGKRAQARPDEWNRMREDARR